MRLAVPEALPIAAHVEQIAAALRSHQVIVVAGETGSGKTTQLPKIALAAGRGARGMIGHTQPRRIAARTLAARIAEECGVELGAEVGFAVRFTDRTARGTRVKVMTDGILLAELQRDRELLRYDTIIIDEAHERSLNIDFLLGYLKRLLPRRPDLRVIVTSATIDVERFSAHFGGAPIMEVSGRTYPVEVRYRPTEDVASDDVDAVCDAVLECLTSGDGDVLVFLSGEREIRDVADALRTQLDATTTVLPLYARLSAAEQHRVFAPGGGRRVVLATNVAETSITVPGIRFVVDPGTARISRYSKRLKVQRLPIEPISQASANQRAGRCGRVRDGIAVRLYSQDDFSARPEYTDPEILRTNLAAVILQMAALRLGDIERFPFLDPPDTRQIRDGIALLVELGALEAREGAGRLPRLTPLGRRLARLPLDPRLGRMVLAAADAGCVREVVVIVGGLTIQDPRERPEAERGRADAMHARFVDRRSDFLTLLSLWEHIRAVRRATSANGLRRACREQYLNYLRIREWQDLVGQVREVLSGLGIGWSSAPDDPDGIHRALLTGLLSQVGAYDELRRDYLGARGARFVIFPGSALARTTPDWVMSAELVETSRLFARRNAVVNPDWVEQAAEHLVSRSYSEPRWSQSRGATVATERVTLYGIPLVTGRAVDYGRIDPALSRELFIRGALVEGQWHTRHRFWRANEAALATAREVEERSRRRGLVIDDEGLFAFYDARIPADVTSVRHFDSWWKRTARQTPDLLTLTEADLHAGGDLPDESEFPLRWSAGPDVTLDLSYAFEPGAAADGVTVDVPLAVLPDLDPAEVPGAAPGLRGELVAALLRSPAKAIRRQVGPAPNLVPDVLAAAELREQPILEGVAAAVSRLTGVRLRPEDFDLARVPLHLLPRYRIVDEAGAALGEGRDLAALQRRHAPDRAAMLARSAADISASGATGWTFGAIPQSVERVVSGIAVTGYPALVDRGASVDLTVLPDRAVADRAHRRGVRRLVALAVPHPGPRGFAGLDMRARLVVGRYPHGGAQALLDDVADACIGALLAGPAIRDAAGFAAAVDRITLALPGAFAAALAHAVAALEPAWEAERAVAGLTSPVVAESVADVRAELDRLVGPRPVSRIGTDRLGDLRRYLQALAWRAAKLPDDPAGDARRLASARAAERLMAEHVPGWPVPDSGDASAEAATARRMLDEYRVSLFAQHIRTAMPVSERRIEKFLAGLPG